MTLAGATTYTSLRALASCVTPRRGVQQAQEEPSVFPPPGAPHAHRSNNMLNTSTAGEALVVRQEPEPR
eukprot:4503642-Pyramimonas_sp.AAC.1